MFSNCNSEQAPAAIIFFNLRIIVRIHFVFNYGFCCNHSSLIITFVCVTITIVLAQNTPWEGNPLPLPKHVE